MKLESRVIGNQQISVKLFSSSVHTARHALGIGGALQVEYLSEYLDVKRCFFERQLRCDWLLV
jgi:hypothetical protein